MTRQSVWIVRYGLTKYPLVENAGPYDSELDPTEGVDHAKSIARRISSNEGDLPKYVYSSPFVRTTHTAQLIALELPSGSVRIEGGLTEWQIPSLLVDKEGVRTYPKDAKQLAETYDTIDLSYESVNPPSLEGVEEVTDGAPKFEESEQDLMKRCSKTLEGILKLSNGESFVLVSHAPCDQALALHLEGKGPSDSKLGPWPLGGITKFSRCVNDDGSFGEWELDFYGETEHHMPGKYKPGIKAWSLPILSGKPA
mmetsp:Transcript_87612/g.131393  ORF Transcript_87612/g.131393 Transcript_87612/m.131393 type:complete len:254 (-) Transcript_87612:452-1213(-)